MTTTIAGYQLYEPVVESGSKGIPYTKETMQAREVSANSSTKLRVLSVLESSNNANNIAAIAESSSNNNSSRRGSERESSCMGTTDHQIHRQVSWSSRNSGHKESISSQPCPNQIHCDDPVPIDGEEVMIEEKRKRLSGEGFTTHMYRRGRMLGKGGFAKVYLCTALDTNKNYAVKVVPKANLVKTRARQKVSLTGGLAWVRQTYLSTASYLLAYSSKPKLKSIEC